MEETEEFLSSSWNTRFALKTKAWNYLCPSVIGASMNFYIIGDDNSNVYFWKD